MQHRHDSDGIEHFLVDGGPRPEREVLLAHGLVPYATARATGGVPIAEGRPILLGATARHLDVKSKVVPLLEAWRQNGIAAIVFKGFYLAEFVYTHVGERPYFDVDLVISDDHEASALEVAERLGWTVHSRRAESITNPFSHTTASLWMGGVTVEVHRFVVHCSTSIDSVQRRLTKAAWRSARAIAWQGTTLHALDPRDSLLMGFVLNRAWSGDRWRLRATDFLDTRSIVERFGITREALVERAEELGCATTLRLMLKRCDVWQGRLDLRPPTWAREWQWNLSIAGERGLLPLQRARVKYRGALPLAALQAPRTWRVHRLLARGEDIATYLERGSVPVRGPVCVPEQERRRRILGATWAARIVRPFGARSRLRSIVLYEALREMGVPVTLFLGDPTGNSTHDAPAWVQIDDRPPPKNVVGTPSDGGVRSFTSHPTTRASSVETPAMDFRSQ